MWGSEEDSSDRRVGTRQQLPGPIPDTRYPITIEIIGYKSTSEAKSEARVIEGKIGESIESRRV